MTTVYRVSRSDLLRTRLVLPCTPWATSVLERLEHAGFKVRPTLELQEADTRGEAELRRVDELLKHYGR